VRATGELGAIVLMFVAGLETDLQQMRRVGVAACVTAVGGVVLPFVVGRPSRRCGPRPHPEPLHRTLLTATSVSISAQTLQELGTLRSREGDEVLGAAVVDDVLGLAVLSGVIAYSTGGGGAWPLLRMALFVPLAIAVGFWIVPHLGAWAARLPTRAPGWRWRS